MDFVFITLGVASVGLLGVNAVLAGARASPERQSMGRVPGRAPTNPVRQLARSDHRRKP